MLALLTALVALVSFSLGDVIYADFTEWSARGLEGDLFRYITRPDLTPPKLSIRLNKKWKTAPGYIFVAPYDCLECSKVATTSYITQQIGPHIYTQDGELVWSGNELFPDKKVFDFQAIMIDNKHHLALISPEDAEWRPYPDGVAMILDSSYKPTFSIGTKELGHRIDMHEFSILRNGHSALIGLKDFRVPTESDQVEFQGKMMDCLFTELDLRTTQQIFKWRASDYINISVETSNPPPKNGEVPEFWDWCHVNSIDKDDYGNYLISARFTNTVYYISGDTGKILWRLGGPKSDFTMDFSFSRQHHARIRRQSAANMVISLFDNAADDTEKWTPTSTSSRLLIIGLDFKTMVATLYHRHIRPDRGLSETKGNVQYLPSGGIFAGWGENAMMSEYATPGGEMVYEASFTTNRFANYRAYKMPFVGRPTTKPASKAFVSTNSRAQFMTSVYVSWNGATEVARWRFYARTGTTSSVKITPIGEAVKSGFETHFVSSGYHPIVFAEAVDSSGTSLGNSSSTMTEVPKGFHDPGNPMHKPSEAQFGSHFWMQMILLFMAGFAARDVWEWSRYGKQTFTARILRSSRQAPKRS